MHKKLKFLFFVFYLFSFSFLFSQQNFHLNRQWTLDYEKQLAKISSKDTAAFENNQNGTVNISCVKPYIVSPVHTVQDKTKPWLIRKLIHENLFIVNDTADNFYLTIDPLFNFEGGLDLADSSGEKLYRNTRGFLIRGDIAKKVAFESSFYETQATYAQYIDDYIISADSLFPETRIVPGQGRAKVFNTNGYDFAMASGYVSYSPCINFNIQLGHGKHFIGDGYRSLLLSDNSHNYPYARLTNTFKNFEYTNLYTVFMNMNDGGVKTPTNIERLFQKKVGSFQMLSAKFFERLHITIFQGMIWQASDSTNKQHLSFNTFNPIIGVNSAVYGLSNNNNVLLGAALKFKITNSISVFGQFVLDDIGSKNTINNKFGYQSGVKYFDAFTIKNLNLQAEYNSVRPYTYAAQKTAQSYTHYNQALAHPLGANFNEVVGFVNYRIKRFFAELKVNYAVKGADSSSFNYGGNVFKRDGLFPANQDFSSIITTQGVKTTIMYQDFHLGYLINPATNMNIVIGVSNRIFKTDKTTNTRYVYLSLRTSIANFYFDF